MHAIIGSPSCGSTGTRDPPGVLSQSLNEGRMDVPFLHPEFECNVLSCNWIVRKYYVVSTGLEDSVMIFFHSSYSRQVLNA